MRQREPYSVDKQHARNRIFDLIDYIDYVPLYPWEEKIYRERIAYLAKRYGLKKDLKRQGYDINGVRIADLKTDSG